MLPYEECINCVATKFCKLYKGEIKKTSRLDWCNAHFRLEKAIELSDIPPEYKEANIYNSIPFESNKDIYSKIYRYISDIVNFVDKGYNALFYGDKPGTGKTYSGVMLLNHYIYKICLTDRFDFENPLALFVDYAELMDEIRYSDDGDYINNMVERIKNVPLLLLDDVGAGTMSDFVREQTFLIINYRFNHNLSTIITTNYTVNNLPQENVLGKRITSRILNKCIGFEFKGVDRRVHP